MRKAGIKYRIMSKKLIFGQTYMKFVVAITTSKIAEQLLKVSAP